MFIRKRHDTWQKAEVASSASQFVEGEARDLLEKLPPKLRVVYAACCAERLIPNYARYTARTGYGNPALLMGALDMLWRHLEGEEYSDEAIKTIISQCMFVTPEQEGWPWSEETSRASDAAVATIYALEAHSSETCQEALWAGRTVFDSLDEHIVDIIGVNVADPSSSRMIREHPLFQEEVKRQRRDLNDLLRIAGTPDLLVRFMRELRERAQAEAPHVFQDVT